MRIGIVIEHFDPHRGGAEQWTHQFTEQLLAGGHETHVVAGDFGDTTRAMPIVRHHLPKTRDRLEFAAAAERKLRSLSLDVIHDMGSGWYCDVFESHDGSRYAQWEQKLQTLPAPLRPIKRRMTRVLPRYQEFRRLLARQFADPGRIILALSKMVATDYLRYHGVHPEQIRQIYNGVDTERFSPDHRRAYREGLRRQLGVDNDETLLLFVGHDFQRKGLGTAIRATARLVRAGEAVRMVVVGGRRSWRAKHLAQRLGAGRQIAFIGSVLDTVPFYAASDVYVLPTFYDPCSLGVLEAAASGLPSVTSRFNGAGEMLSDGLNGLLMDDPADDEELAELIRPLLDRETRSNMGRAARHFALDHTLARNCAEIVAVYRDIAGLARRAA
ncbi:MAG TPA: glycosyltransferase family 4 protein [Thermoguttaceae bacterium]|nr:glycosyltransferase family 4 protein [Thermoguttaceae bacterium]